MKTHSATSYYVHYKNSSGEVKDVGLPSLDAAESYFEEKVEMGYKPTLYSQTTIVETILIRK
jgi:hypothetical protein